jgi:hypothetical protein
MDHLHPLRVDVDRPGITGGPTARAGPPGRECRLQADTEPAFAIPRARSAVSASVPLHEALEIVPASVLAETRGRTAE